MEPVQSQNTFQAACKRESAGTEWTSDIRDTEIRTKESLLASPGDRKRIEIKIKS